MPDTLLYYNPACSKCREALALLEAGGVTPQLVRYLDRAPGAEEIRGLLDLLGLAPRALLRDGEPEYAALGLADPALPDEALIAAMAAYPRLIQRPIFVHGGRAVIGRPPERVLELLR